VMAENYILCNGLHEEALIKGINGLVEMMAFSNDEEEPLPLDAYSDTWGAMALRTAVLAGLRIPDLQDHAVMAQEKVALLAERENRDIYASIPPLYTASEGALAALFLEDQELEPDEGITFPDKNDPDTLFALLEDPDFREPSFLFFIGTALCGDGGKLWQDWNGQVKEILIEEQKQDGSWLAGGDWPWIDGGDLYTTALHLLTLQVYYRYIKLEENCN